MAFPPVGRRRLVLAGIVASIALLVGIVAFVQLRAAASWEQMQETVRELRARYDERGHRRDPLWGDATESSAFAHYDRATVAARRLRSAHYDALLKLLPQSDAHVATEVPKLRAAWQPVLQHLHAGAHATAVRPRVAPDADLDQQMADLLDAKWVANAAMFEARALRHEGRSVEAVQWSLDAATFAADLMHGSAMVNRMIGTAILAIATCGWHDDAALRAASPEALQQLAAGLERLDAALPETIDLTSDLLLCARGLQEAGSHDEWMPSAWRYGFSTRWMIADAFVEYATTADDLGAASSNAWPKRDAMLELVGKDALDSPNPLMAIVIPNLWAAEFSVRETIARMRLLRTAIELHRGNDAPPLRDPLGNGPLMVTREDGGVRIASAGSTERRKIERFVPR